jgi:hypothetical protein
VVPDGLVEAVPTDVAGQLRRGTAAHEDQVGGGQLGRVATGEGGPRVHLDLDAELGEAVAEPDRRVRIRSSGSANGQ